MKKNLKKIGFALLSISLFLGSSSDSDGVTIEEGRGNQGFVLMGR